ncbi:hypothetical protein [Glaciimonas sp. GG7]
MPDNLRTLGARFDYQLLPSTYDTFSHLSDQVAFVLLHEEA